jgi:glycosyltransferase involved in cell wall biosynthesis
MTVGLVMIVKNEVAILPRLADSVRDHIDHWTVVDTGSTDLTIDTVYAVFAGIPGTVIQHEFDGFGPTRNVALREAEQHTDWMLCLDADETFHGRIQVNDGIDIIEAEQHNGPLRFWLPRLLKSGRGWESRGRSHEYYWSPIGSATWPVRTDAFYIEHHGDGHDRPNKFHRDADLLLKDWAEDNTNPRTAFYLARTYDDMGEPAEAVGWYRQRINMGGWDEETFYAKFRLGVSLLNLGAKEEGCGFLWSAWADKPHRAEPMVALSEHYRLAGQWTLAWHAASLAQEYYDPEEPGLFVDTSMEWRVTYEISISAWYTDHKDWGKLALNRLLRYPDIPEPFHSSIRSNQEFYFS